MSKYGNNFLSRRFLFLLQSLLYQLIKFVTVAPMKGITKSNIGTRFTNRVCESLKITLTDKMDHCRVNLIKLHILMGHMLLC